MKTLYMSAVVSGILFLSGCGTGSSNSIGSTSSNVIQVVRGPVLGAIVKDSSGKIAKELNDGKGDYSFNGTINYPVTATGGVIDIDRDGKISTGDVKNDLTLTTTSGNVITMLTTYASDPTTKPMLENVAKSFNLSLAALESKTPLNSKEVEAISNVMYKFAQDNNITQNTTSEIEKEIKSEYLKYSGSHDSQKTEKELTDKLESESKISKLSANEVENEISKLNNEYSSSLHKYELENGDSEYVSNGQYSSHYQGENCLKCHGVGGIASEPGEAGENQFTSGGTVFTKLRAQANDGVSYASGYSIRLSLENVSTTINYNQGRGTGNSNASFSVGAINGYTAEVINSKGMVVNASAKNSHNVARLDCNRCHTSAGANGAPGRIVSFKFYGPLATTTPSSTTSGSSSTTSSTSSSSTTSGSTTSNPTTPSTTNAKSFKSDVLPILQAKCASCHGSFGKFSITNSSTPYLGVAPFVDKTNATASRLLQKSSGTMSHGGGVVIGSTTTEYATIRDWISAGANNN